MENQEQNEFDIRQLWRAFRRFWYVVLAVTVLCAVLAGVLTTLYAKSHPSYIAESRYLVVAGSSNSSNYYQDSLLAKDRVSDVVEVVQSRTAMQYVLTNAGMDITRLNAAMKMISVKSTGSTSIFSVTVRGSVPSDVKELTLALEQYLPMYISGEVFKQGETRLQLFDKAFLSSSAMPAREGSYTLRNVALFALIGAVLSYVVVLIIHICDKTVYNEETLQGEFSQVPVLGTIPSISSPDEKKGWKRRGDTRGEHDYRSRVLGADMPFHASEAYRALRTSVSYLVPGQDQGVVLGVTSDQSGEGKSLTAANLAICFSQLNKKVLLVEADMRMPTQYKIFGYAAENGLADVLAGLVSDYRACLVEKSEYPNLQILPMGHLPPNPAELLASEQMKALLTSLRDDYDIILVDLPPLGVVSDAGVLANSVDRYLLAVRANYSDTAGIRKILTEMQRISMHIGGFVLTDLPVTRSSYYYDKKHYYHRNESGNPPQQDTSR